MEMYDQGKYTITLKKMEMYNVTSTPIILYILVSQIKLDPYFISSWKNSRNFLRFIFFFSLFYSLNSYVVYLNIK